MAMHFSLFFFFFFFFFVSARQTVLPRHFPLISSIFSLFLRPATLTPSDSLPYPRPLFWILFLQSQSSNLILFRLPLINTSLDPVLTPLGNSRETLASGDSGLGLGLIFRVSSTRRVFRHPRHAFLPLGSLGRGIWNHEMGGGGAGPGGIKGSRFFSCSVAFLSLLWLLYYLLSLFLLRGVYSQPSSPVLLNHPDLFAS
ncbi:uncharacterized protein ASPGLDRAFT_1174412 [Aspergillus glaucus CBS 516.65]|uniref:Transmembrane protein n=1 Tax=Aspergillus glaucus CBS 516.65 TaxID=1160497 RepID=A0A1L9VU65_ASPGL|nr:hypothetical protein ASPGLDRAFT_1174412 [Aspergillus glaucus CBS 516.65]OJJ87427.1 hypothetical protein ASPGLDRAFT_1174412 [Aspergillus glaucus CBS 516.65]